MRRMTGKFRRPENATTFRAAISQWQLAARTEVKRYSSLPSSMFGACDPTLEARLAESVEAMMHCLHQPEAAALAKSKPSEDIEMRVETVTPEELAKLPQQLQGEEPPIDLDSGVSAEYLSLLIDACTTGDDATQEASRALLQEDFAVATNSNLHEATKALVQCLQELDEEDREDAGHDTHDRLNELCSAIAASVIVEGHAANHPENESQ